MGEAVRGIVVQRPIEREWRAWISTLRTGDTVLVCYEVGGESIYKDQVRVTPAGKVFVGDDRRTNWSKSPVMYVLGGGRRFIAPVPR